MRTLRFRLILWFSFAVTATAGSAAWLGFVVIHRQMIDGIDFLLEAEIQEVLARLTNLPERQANAASVDAALRGHTDIDAPLYYFQVERLGHGLVFRSRNLGEAALPAGPGAPATRTVSLAGEPVRVATQAFRDCQVSVATNMEQVEAMIERYRRALLFGLPVLLAASVATGWLLSVVALRPIGAMQRSARRITASNLSERLPVPPGRDEVAGLARLLNELFARLEASFEQVRRFTADASHELKTPLSLIRLHAERLAHSPGLTEADRSEVEGQIEDIHRLNKLVENLLLLARADAGSLRLERRCTNPQHFLGEFAEDASALAEEQGLRFTVGRNDAGAVFFDPVMIRHVLFNILSNALRHTRAGGAVIVNSTTADGHWELTVDDEGPGLPPEDLERIFGRFVRGPGSEARAPGGSGLGLAIARSIVEAHRGRIWAENRAAGGLRIVIRIPESVEVPAPA